ncbi:MAG TPA: outer membrane protein transport protein [Polyangiaceae bacterium]|nr:outer membrane protein transport protein [Polyangiaceae bacterium]
MIRSGRLLVATWVLLAADTAFASTEINGLFDARSAGMGGTGAAFLDSAAAIPTNPALLDQIGQLTLTANAFLITAQPIAPYTVSHLDAAGQRYQNYETIRSPATTAVLPFVGGAYRVLDRLVVGIAAYPTIGQGTSARYRPAPDEFPQIELSNKASMGLFEIGTAASVRVLDNLSVALMWRVSHMSQDVSTPVPGGPPIGTLLDSSQNPIYANIDVKGFNFAGLQAGVFYKPLSNLRLGLTYRNKVVAEGTGTTTTKNPVSGEPLVIDTRTNFTSPHTVRAGVALSVLEDKLLLAVDFKYLMYAEAWKETETLTTRNGTTSSNVTPTYWKDAYNIQLGAEFKAGEMFRPRAGYVMATSATNAAYAQQLMAPPGVSHLVSAGLGIKIVDRVNVDFAAAYVVLQSRVETATPYNAGVGIYGSHAGEFSLSCTYHM